MKKAKAIGITVFSLVLAASLAACGSTQTAQKEASKEGGSKPETQKSAGFALERDVEFVVPYSAGGGSDTNARFIAKVMQDNKLIDKNILVVNKPGGSGAVGNTYTNSKKGDPHTISTWVTGQMTSALTSNAEVGLEDLTPLATLALDPFLLVVDKDSPYQTFEDFVNAAKANPGQISVGGTGKGGEDHVVFYLTSKSTGTEMKYVVFQGGGEVMAAVLGGHVSAIFTNPNEVVGQLESGELRALGVTSKEKLQALNQVPTFAELGYPDIYFEQFRGIVGPPDLSPEAIAYWDGIFKKVADSEQWKEEYIKPNSLTATYKNAADSKQFYEQSLEQYKVLLTELGVLK